MRFSSSGWDVTDRIYRAARPLQTKRASPNLWAASAERRRFDVTGGSCRGLGEGVRETYHWNNRGAANATYCIYRTPGDNQFVASGWITRVVRVTSSQFSAPPHPPVVLAGC